MRHPDFAMLTVSWELALRADGYAVITVKAYQNARPGGSSGQGRGDI